MHLLARRCASRNFRTLASTVPCHDNFRINPSGSAKNHPTLTFSSQAKPIIDDQNLLRFDTLHELNTNASIAFADNPIFGTYTEAEGKDPSFEYITYAEYGEKVDLCRSVLKDLGMFRMYASMQY